MFGWDLRVCAKAAAAAAVAAEKGRSFHWLAGELGSSPRLWLRRSLKIPMLMHGGAVADAAAVAAAACLLARWRCHGPFSLL